MRATRPSAVRPARCRSRPAPTRAAAAGQAPERPNAVCTFRGLVGVVTQGPRVTHEVHNQVPPLAGHDVAADPALLEAVDREGGGWAAASVHELGLLAGRAETAE